MTTDTATPAQAHQPAQLHQLEPVDPPRLPAANHDMPEKPQQLPARGSTTTKPARTQGGKGGLTRKVKAAIDRMVWHGRKRTEAAADAKLTDDAFRKALRKPIVLRYYNEQLDVLRNSARPRALQRIADLADKSESEKVGLDAAKYLDSGGKSDQTNINLGVQVNVSPGYVIAVPSADKQARQIAQQAGSVANCLDKR